MCLWFCGVCGFVPAQGGCASVSVVLCPLRVDVDLFVCGFVPSQGGWMYLSVRGNALEAQRAPARSPQPSRAQRQVNGNIIAC